MLILTRQVGEIIVIGEGDKKVEVMILEVRGNQVRLGIEAPKDISVHREEIFEKIIAERNLEQVKYEDEKK